MNKIYGTESAFYANPLVLVISDNASCGLTFAMSL